MDLRTMYKCLLSHALGSNYCLCTVQTACVHWIPHAWYRSLHLTDPLDHILSVCHIYENDDIMLTLGILKERGTFHQQLINFNVDSPTRNQPLWWKTHLGNVPRSSYIDGDSYPITSTWSLLEPGVPSMVPPDFARKIQPAKRKPCFQPFAMSRLWA